MTYPADPGGVFASDVHRRVLGHVPEDPMDNDELYERLKPDDHTPIGYDELADVLSDLEADGYAKQSGTGWKQTKKGLDALCAPVPEED